MIRAVFAQIVLSQLLPDFIRGYADDGVLASIEILRKLKKLDADRTFLEGSTRTGNGVLNHVIQKLPAAFAGAKRSALQQAIEFGPEFLRL